MPEEVLGIVIVVSFLTFIFTVIRSTQQYKLKKLDHEAGKSGDSLTTSELQVMIEDAVADATAPLRDRVDSLSERLAAVEQPGSSKLDEVELDIEPMAGDKTVGRQVRRERA